MRRPAWQAVRKVQASGMSYACADSTCSRRTARARFAITISLGGRVVSGSPPRHPFAARHAGRHVRRRPLARPRHRREHGDFSLVDRLVLRSLPVREPAGSPWWRRPLSSVTHRTTVTRSSMRSPLIPIVRRRARRRQLLRPVHARRRQFPRIRRSPVRQAATTLRCWGSTRSSAASSRLPTTSRRRPGRPDCGPELYSVEAPFNGDAKAVGMHVLLDRGTGHHRRRAAAVLSRNRSRPNTRRVPANSWGVRRPIDDTVRSVLVWLNVIVRLKPGQTVASSAAALRGLQPELRSTTRPPNESPAEYLKEPLTLAPASGGRAAARPHCASASDGRSPPSSPWS